MRKIKMKLPLTLGFLACFLVLAFTVNYRGASVPAAAGANGNMVIVLDAGHGGLDSGCVGVGGELEKDINLAIVKNLKQLLEFSGFDVVLTRSEDVSIHDENIAGVRNQKVSDMENRKKIVEKYPDSIFFSIHQNQFTQAQYFGAQMFYSTRNKTNFKLAQYMQTSFQELQPANNREIKLIDNALFLFKETVQPALLIECGFLSNADDAKNLGNAEYQKKVAFTIYKGMQEYLKYTENISDETSEENDVETENTLYMQ